MKNQETKLEKAFKLFLGSEDLRPVMHNPFILNGYTYATDEHVLIRTKNENIDFEFNNPYDNIPKAESLFKDREFNEVMDFSGLDFEALKTADELIHYGKDAECEECDGCGEVTWEYKNHTKEMDCPICDGSGNKESKKLKKTGGKTFEDKTFIKINEHHFNINLFYKLIQVQQLIGGEIKLIQGRKHSDPMMFEIDSCEILIMPMSAVSKEDAVYIYPFKS